MGCQWSRTAKKKPPNQKGNHTEPLQCERELQLSMGIQNKKEPDRNILFFFFLLRSASIQKKNEYDGRWASREREKEPRLRVPRASWRWQWRPDPPAVTLSEPRSLALGKQATKKN